MNNEYCPQYTNGNPVFFKTPFSSAYWKSAFAETKKIRMLILAAFVIVLRVAIEKLSIPVGVDLEIRFTYFVNAVGSMVYGPVLGLLTGAVTDTISAVFFPSPGMVYFFPYIFIEMAGSFIFGLFLYRAPISAVRTILSRFSVVFICNLIMSPIVYIYYARMMYGKNKAFMSIFLPRVAKNLLLWPAESFLLVLFLGATIPVLIKIKVIPGQALDMKITTKHIMILAALFLVSAASVCYYYFKYIYGV